MDNCLLGSLIREYRERAGISREELAGDFCAVSTLMRIETCEEIPGRLLANELCSALGLVAPYTNDGELSREEVVRCIIERKINEKLFVGEYDYEPLLKEFADCGEMDAFEQQFRDYCMGLMLRHNGASPQALFDLYTSSIALTLFSRTESFLPKRVLLSKMELLLIRQIAVLHYSLGRHDDAIAIMNYLDKYYARGICLEHVSESEYPQVLRFLAEWNLARGMPDLVLPIAERGFVECTKSGLLHPFARLMRARANALFLLNSKDAAYEKELSDTLFSMIEEKYDE